MRAKVRAGHSETKKLEGQEIKELERRLVEEAPPPASSLLGSGPDGAPKAALRFSELPISQRTRSGLGAAGYESLTAIQRFALPQALCGRDVLGAAKTGSGKTLAFLIPVLEALFRLRWGALDGLGALVISPTRELAMQIFDELRKVGGRHELSAGLLIGGKNVREEQSRVGGMNILVCTPGRLLQHMDETPGFDAGSLRVLVLDEADRILDMGFSRTVNAIVENLPSERQTLLFSATQTKSVKQLARLSLRDPEYVAVHERAQAPTPAKLQQAYAVCEVQDKLSILWSFIRTHVKAKILVFVSTAKQVRFIYEAFKRLRPGAPLRSLHGNMRQSKRMAVFYDFAKASDGMVLFATDIAARGLDFSKLDWVVQMDCPEDAAAYIHRVGRTARYVSAGRSLLLLAPSERAFLEQLAAAKIPVRSTKINPSKTQPLQPSLQALLSKFAELKAFAQSAMTAYLRSVHLAPNKAVFDVTKLPVADFALSLGLAAVPKLSFVDRRQAGAQTAVDDMAGNGDAAETAAEAAAAELAERCSDDGAAGQLDAPAEDDGAAASEDELLSLKPGRAPAEDAEAPAATVAAAPQAGAARGKRKRLKIRPGAAPASRVVFDEDGVALDPLAALAADSVSGDDAGESRGHASAHDRYRAAATALKARDAKDKSDYQQRRRQKLTDLKAKRKARDDLGGEPVVTLGPGLGYPGEEEAAATPADDRSASPTADGGSDWDSDLEREAAEAIFGSTSRRKAGKRRRTQPAEAAHIGMASKAPADMSLAEQEVAALELLRRR